MSPRFQYSPGDVIGCVRIVEEIVNNFNSCSELSKKNYEIHSLKFTEGYQSKSLSLAITDATANYRDKLIPKEFSKKYFYYSIYNPLLDCDCIKNKIALLSGEVDGLSLIGDAVNIRVDDCSVVQELIRCNVFPHYYSSELKAFQLNNKIYLSKLANYYFNDTTIKFSSDIIFRLLSSQNCIDRVLSILVVGDVLAIHAIRVASAGFVVNYLSEDNSISNEVALSNIEEYNSRKESLGQINVLAKDISEVGLYDTIICLDVMDLCLNPLDMLSELNSHLLQNGLLFISEKFGSLSKDNPMQLESNECIAGILPLAAELHGFKVDGIFSHVNNNLYIFSKSSTEAILNVNDLVGKQNIISHLVNEQMQIVPLRTTTMSKFLYLFKRININIMRYYYRAKLLIS